MLRSMPNPEEVIGSANAMLIEMLHRAGVRAGFGPCPAADLQTVTRDLPLSGELRNLYGTSGPLDTVNIPAPLGGSHSPLLGTWCPTSPATAGTATTGTA